ncbi:MAG: helix-turn-helix domain-containing protein [Planctomycetaceae bacterium]|jgi:NADH/NAD ratio-sensing transcriptional regulator Rex|nr:helix-turn-helix domain-containing protein [Planctomycetaceae bacterium]
MHGRTDLIQFFKDHLVDKTERPTIRHWKLLRLLSESPEGVSFKDLTERLGITTRTVNHDLVLFQEVGILLQKFIGPHSMKLWSIFESDSVPLEFF